MDKFATWDHDKYQYLQYKNIRENLEHSVLTINNLTLRLNDISELLQISKTENDPSALSSLFSDLNIIKQDLQVLQSYRNFSDKHDYANAFLEIEINSDSDSEIWGNQLLQMYINWAESHQIQHDIFKNFRVKKHDIYIDEVSLTFRALIKFSGKYTYGLLKHETGQHRLISTDKLATISVYPEIISDIEEMNFDDYSIEVIPHTLKYQSNMIAQTSSHIRVIHLATGIETDADCERSQHLNKGKSIDALMSKLYYHTELTKSIQTIRIYNPQTNIVKDLIYDIENNFQDTVDGNIDGFIEARLNLAL